MTLEVYVDLAAVPFDDPPPDIGDGGTVPNADGTPAKKQRPWPSAAQLAPAVQHSLVVPFNRLIASGSRGTDVRGAKRAIWRANGLKTTAFTPVFGPIAVQQLKEFQHRKGLKADGQVGPTTLHQLAPYFDRYAFLLYEGYPPGLTAVQAKRQRALAYLLWGYNSRASIYYGEFRPMELLNDLEHLPVTEDCSTFYTKMAKYASWTDPNGLGYDGAGNTTTLCAHGIRVDLEHAQVGDGIFYSSPAHVGAYVGSGRLISLGSNPGPSLVPVTYRNDFAQARDYL